MPKFYTTIAVTGAARENVMDAFAGLGEKKRRVVALYPHIPDQAVTAENTYHLRAYKDQTRVVDFHTGLFTSGVTASVDKLAILPRVELNLEFERGQGFKVGYYAAAENPVGNVIMEYEDLD